MGIKDEFGAWLKHLIGCKPQSARPTTIGQDLEARGWHAQPADAAGSPFGKTLPPVGWKPSATDFTAIDMEGKVDTKWLIDMGAEPRSPVDVPVVVMCNPPPFEDGLDLSIPKAAKKTGYIISKPDVAYEDGDYVQYHNDDGKPFVIICRKDGTQAGFMSEKKWKRLKRYWKELE